MKGRDREIAVVTDQIHALMDNLERTVNALRGVLDAIPGDDAAATEER